MTRRWRTPGASLAGTAASVSGRPTFERVIAGHSVESTVRAVMLDPGAQQVLRRVFHFCG